MSKDNVLVFPCGSEIGLEIYRSLNMSTHFNLIGGSSVNDHGSYVFENYIGNIPFVDDENFVSVVNKVIKKNNIKYIYPAHDSVVLKLALAVEKNELACEIITSPYETCNIARSKSKTYNHLKDIISTPKVYTREEVNNASFPLFMKPDIGQGSKGVHLVNSIHSMDYYLNKDSTLILLEYLPGKEFTVDCFTDNTGSLKYSFGRERIRTSGGISVSSKAAEIPEIIDIANKINNSCQFNGAWFFQLKEAKDGTLKLLEIAPRIAGTMALSRSRGVNLPLLSLFNAKDQEVEILQNNYNISVDRALFNVYKHDIEYDHVYIDYDDLIISDDKINTSIIAFIFQCVNKEISIHLITRHKGDIINSLKKNRILALFDEVIEISENDEKHNYILREKSIFIDDSHRERKLVFENCKIPVFDTHMIEALIE